MTDNKRKLLISGVLVALAVGLLIPIYMVPTWWVSLEAPNYPEEAFPDGVRIIFHVNGVFNGCEKIEKVEIQEDEALDCVHEMDTINHYVGMYPIASGGPVELFFSVFLFGLVAVMLLGWIFVKPLIRTIVMSVGFAVLIVWMGLAWYGEGGLKYHNAKYLEGRITVLGEDVEDDEETMTAAEALIARLKASLAESEATEEEVADEADAADLSDKEKSIRYLENAYISYNNRKSTPGEEWRGSGSQLVPWHYEKSLGRYFRDSDALSPMVSKMTTAGNFVFWFVTVIAVLILIVARKPRGIINWALICIPITLPVLFVIEYVAWLWWYGHNMSSMGAFTLKAFMPTAFGQGKVAQFTTNSYPDVGFWLMVLFSVLLVAAALLRRQTTARESE
ncbi:MAG: hypothetical protein GY835_25475 [bacterium]|nr:hypothetical protein [bacterium]